RRSSDLHPPLEMGAQSVGATRRAARLTDGVFFGPQISWDSVAKLALVFRDARQEAGQVPGPIGASRALIVGPNRQAATTAARAYLEKTFAMYRAWELQESTMMQPQRRF